MSNIQRTRVQPLPKKVFLGARTSVLRDRNARSSARHTVENTGFGDVEGPRHAEHFVVEAEEPSTGEPHVAKTPPTTKGRQPYREVHYSVPQHMIGSRQRRVPGLLFFLLPFFSPSVMQINGPTKRGQKPPAASYSKRSNVTHTLVVFGCGTYSRVLVNQNERVGRCASIDMLQHKITSFFSGYIVPGT